MLTSLEPFISVQEEVNVQKEREKKKNQKEKQDSYFVALKMQYPLLVLKYYKRIAFTFHIRTYKKICFFSVRDTLYALSS